jgi:2-polyprenyl-3-methyl-5-hydroxy-6-metoxy-1,4-benzoquinol methylase
MPKTYSSVPGKERQETIPCPLCGNAVSRTFLPCDGFVFVRCTACSVVYQNPRPVFDDLRRRYGEEYFTYEITNEEAFFRLMRLGMADVGFQERTAGLPAPRRFLDIGCATGMLIESMKKEGWETQGVDVCRESAEYGMSHRGVNIFVGTLEEAHFPDNRFQVVHFSHLIEHVPDPRGFLAEVKRILAPGGLAVITTPNVDGFQARLFRKAWRSAIADHLVLFSRKTLGRLIAEAGFDIRQSVTWGGLALGTTAPIIKKPVDRLAKAWGFGDVVLYLAAKRQDQVTAGVTSGSR